jgi:hypothetical protein
MNSFAKIPSKNMMYLSGGLLSSLGFYRGYEQYNFYHVKRINKKPDFENYMCSVVFGVINASLYINPALCGFAIYEEYKKIKMFIANEYDEKEYYNNLFFNNTK